MNLYFQIAAGLLPAVILLVGYLLWARKHWASVFCALFLILGAGGALGWLSGHETKPAASWRNEAASARQEDEEESGREMNEEDFSWDTALELIYGLAAEEQTDEAMETLLF